MHLRILSPRRQGGCNFAAIRSNESAKLCVLMHHRCHCPCATDVQRCLPTRDTPRNLKKAPFLQGAPHCSALPHHALDSSATEAPLSPLTSPGGVLASVDINSREMLLQDSESARTPQPPKGEEGLQGEKSSHITPKGSQPQIKQTGSSQTSTEKKPSSSGFCLSADAPPYTPQSSAAKQETKATNSLGAVAETFDLGFIRPFNSPLGHQQQHNLQQKHGYASLTAPLTTSGDARVPRRAESVGLTQAEAQLQSDTTRKLSLKPSANAVTSTVPLKFCKFLVGEDVAGFLVGRKGVGGPALTIKIGGRWHMLFSTPCEYAQLGDISSLRRFRAVLVSPSSVRPLR